MRSFGRAAHAAFIAIVVSTAAAGTARAQTSPSDQVAAQALYDAAKALMAQKKYAEACPKFAESQRLDAGTGTHYALADCYEQAGRLAAAWEAFLEVQSESQAQNRPERVAEAKRRAGLLAPRLSKITINVPDASKVDGLTVKRDADVVRDGQWGVDVPVDPGTHVILATAPGKLPWQTQINVNVESKVFPVTVPPLQPDPNAVTTPTPPTQATTPQITGPSTPPPPPLPPPDQHHGLGSQRTAAIVVGSVGVVGVAVGAVFGVMALGKHSDSQSNCTGSVCNPTGLSDTQDGKTDGTVSTVAIGVGAAALVGAAVLWFTAPKAPKTTGLTAAPLVGAHTGGFSLQGAF